jgi:hypothetical protein
LATLVATRAEFLFCFHFVFFVFCKTNRDFDAFPTKEFMKQKGSSGKPAACFGSYVDLTIEISTIVVDLSMIVETFMAPMNVWVDECLGRRTFGRRVYGSTSFSTKLAHDRNKCK